MPQFGTAGHGERSRSSSTANRTTGEEIAFSLRTLTDENSKLIVAYLQVIPKVGLGEGYGQMSWAGLAL